MVSPSSISEYSPVMRTLEVHAGHRPQKMFNECSGQPYNNPPNLRIESFPSPYVAPTVPYPYNAVSHIPLPTYNHLSVHNPGFNFPPPYSPFQLNSNLFIPSNEPHSYCNNPNLPPTTSAHCRMLRYILVTVDDSKYKLGQDFYGPL